MFIVVHHHFPCEITIVGSIPHFQTHPFGVRNSCCIGVLGNVTHMNYA